MSVSHPLTSVSSKELMKGEEMNDYTQQVEK